MKFTRDQTSSITISQYADGRVDIGSTVIKENVLVLHDEIIPAWTTDDVSALTEASFTAVFAREPELILLGTGPSLRFPPPGLGFALARRGIGLEVMDTGAACRTFNVLVTEGRRPAAALIL